jgi:hypothetical protein
MERTLISWNLANWITVMLMAAAGYAVLGFVAQMLARQGIGPAATAGGY